jgi:hypothetical protein
MGNVGAIEAGVNSTHVGDIPFSDEDVAYRA